MSTKTITLDGEAYERLKSVQQPDESLSQTIKRLIREPRDWDAWLKSMEQNPLGQQVVEAVDEQVRQRRHSRNRKRRQG